MPLQPQAVPSVSPVPAQEPKPELAPPPVAEVLPAVDNLQNGQTNGLNENAIKIDNPPAEAQPPIPLFVPPQPLNIPTLPSLPPVSTLLLAKFACELLTCHLTLSLRMYYHI